ncbi:MAG: ABC transporter permease [Alphaproteobacteria bacterium]|nr:ABC transporter permease [Alphaproteobacteria bacterium]
MTTLPAARAVSAAALRAALLLLGVSVVVFAQLRAIPGDPVLIALGEGNLPADPATVADWRRSLGLSGSWTAQYLDWLGALAHGDWGLSLRTRRPVALELADRVGWSCAIGVGGVALAATFSLPLGRAAALHPGGAVDGTSRLLAVGLQSIPAFALAIGVVALAASFPGTLRLYTGGVLERIAAPTTLVFLYALSPLVRVVRRAYLDESARPHLRAAEAKGLSRRDALRRHGGRAALLALLAALPPMATWAVGGTAVVEIVFGIPGISQLVVDSVAARDHAVLQVFVMLMALAMVIVHAAVDLARGRLDPRPVE